MGVKSARLGLALLLFSSLSPATLRAAEDAPAPDVRCGGYSLYLALDALKLAPDTYQKFEDRIKPPGTSGYSMLQLQEQAKSYGAKTIAVRTSIENLKERYEPFVCIALIDGNHFVDIYDIDQTYAYIAEFPRHYRLRLDLLRKVWDGEALLVGPDEFQPEEAVTWRRRLKGLVLPVALVLVILVISLFIGRYLLRRIRQSSLSATSLLALASAWFLLGLSGCDHSPGEAHAPERAETPDPQSRPEAGHLVLEPSRIDLGQIRLEKPGQHADVEAVLSNTGRKDLLIHKVGLTCTCTDVKVSTRRIAPGSRAVLKARIKLGESMEPKSSRLTVYSSDPISPATDLVVEWQVKNPLYVPVPSLNFPSVTPNGSASKSLPVHWYGPALCSQCKLQVKADERFLESKLTLKDQPRVSSHVSTAPSSDIVVADLAIKARPQPDPQYLRQVVTLTLQCQGELLSRFVLPVTWQVQPRVSASPSRLYLGQPDAKQHLERRIILRSTEGRAFRVLGVSCEDPDVLVGKSPDSQSLDIHVLDLGFAVPDTSGPWRSAVIVRTDHPEAETVSIPISALIGAPNGSAASGKRGQAPGPEAFLQESRSWRGREPVPFFLRRTRSNRSAL